MQLRTLGGLRLEGAVFSQPKPLLLLAYLALEGPQERWHLAELLWPSSVRAMGNLRAVLSRLRGVSSGMVEVDGVRVWTAVDCDAQALLTALEKDELQSGLELYRGPFLDGLSLRVYGSELEEWVYHTREYLAGRVREALLSLAEIQASHRGFRQAIEQAERAYLLACAPAPEPQELERFHTLFVAGGSHHAKEVHEEGLGFGLSLVVSVAEAKERLRSPQQEDERNGLRNLPDQRTSFVGRALELSEVTELLVQPDCRLLSVVGAGGVGKTRLALKIAQQRLKAGGFADGVVFVPLEAHTSAATIPAVVADALGLTLSGQEDASSVVLRFLAEKRLLLVLDNFEQLLGGTVFVRELTRNCPRLKLLVTSRMKLNLEQEWIVTVEGMTFPEESTTLERAAYFDAVQLFSMRARRAQPGFSLTAETLPAVARICQLVHGMPLAIELAASWLRALPVSEVAKEMEAGTDRLESLTQDVPERHRSVRAVFDHSWSLLSQREKEVLRRLSVFRGGFRREAAAVVSGATLPVLARLVDKSLLYMSLEGRYDRHPLLAQYTREKLAELPEERAEAEQKHGSYYLGLVRDLEPDLWTLERKEALRVFLGELANIRASWDWAAQNLEVDEIEKTTPAMYDFFTIRLSEGLEHFGTTLEFFGSIANHLDENNPSHAAALGTLLVHQVFHAFMMHQDRNLDRDLEQERSLAERGVSLLESVGEPRALAKGYHTLGIQAGWAHFSDAEVMGWHERALAVARKHQSTSDIGHLLWLVGWQLMMRRTDPAKQKRFVEEGLTELREINHLPSVAQFLVFSGETLRLVGRFEEAKALFLEALGLEEELGHEVFMINALNFLTGVSIELGLVDDAASYAGESFRRVEEAGLRYLESDALGSLAEVALAGGDLGRARELLWRVMEVGVRRGDTTVPNSSDLLCGGELLVAEGRVGLAVSLFAYLVENWLVTNVIHSRAERALTELESSLTPEEFAEAVKRGRGMSLEDVRDELAASLAGSGSVGGSA